MERNAPKLVRRAGDLCVSRDTLDLTIALPSYSVLLTLARDAGMCQQELDALLEEHPYFAAAEAHRQRKANRRLQQLKDERLRAASAAKRAQRAEERAAQRAAIDARHEARAAKRAAKLAQTPPTL